MKQLAAFCTGILLLVLGCDMGQRTENLSPETQIFVTEINLTGENRLTTVVRLNWLGTDQDGYVKGYEISINDSDWSFTQQTDSTFRFDLSENSDTTDIDFKVRAIDNLDQIDETPAELIVPIKNTPPVVAFDSLNAVPDTVSGVWSVVWSVSDLDGFSSISSLSFKLNDGPWLPLDPNISFLTLVPTDPFSATETEVNIYSGTEAIQLPEPLTGLNIDGDNRMYLRAVDISGGESAIDTSNVFWVNRLQNDLLLIEDYEGEGPTETYAEIFENLGVGYDILDLENNIPSFWVPTFSLYLEQYSRIFWYSDGREATQGDQLYTDVAAGAIQRYLNSGGKLLLTSQFPNTYNDPIVAARSLVFDFSPMDSLSSSSGQARITTGSLISPTGNWAGLVDTLEASAFISSADPFYAKNPNNDVMLAELTKLSGWEGPSSIGGVTTVENQVNQVFFSVELHKLNGRPAALQNLLDFILNEEFDW